MSAVAVKKSDVGGGYKQTELGLIPEDWEIKCLGDIGDIRMCKRVFNHETSPVGEIPFYKIGTFGGVPDAYISKKLFDTYRSKFSYPKVGDILISAAGTIGRTVVLIFLLLYEIIPSLIGIFLFISFLTHSKKCL